MRLLYLALDCPLPANNGLHMRTSTVLRALRAEGFRIGLVSLAAVSGPVPAGVRDVCDEFWTAGHRAASLSGGGDYPGRLRALASRYPYAAWRFRAPAARALLRRIWNETRYDALVCDTVFPAVNLPPEVRPLVVNHHNIEHRIFESYARQQGRTWRRAAAGWEGRRVERWEAAVGRHTALNLVCSEVDCALLLDQQPHAPVAVVPNIAPEPAAAGSGTAEPDPELVVFQGALDWLPNRDAVDFFLDEIWPAVRAQHPRARFQVVGRNPPADFLGRHSAHPGVEFTGTVADVRPYLGRAAVAVVPLRIGSGTRLKILEAAAMGKAILSTPLGAEGLHFTPGAEIELAASAAGFAAQLVALLQSPQRRAALGAAAQARVQAEYSFAALRRSLRAAFAMLPGTAAVEPKWTAQGAQV